MTSETSKRAPTIVVVDDEPAIRQTMTRFFERRGWKCVAFADGEAAEAALFGNETAFDVVLCDLRLPLRSGLELYHRAAAERPDVAGRFVLSSGDTEGVTVGCPILAKPFPLSEVAAMADEILHRHDAA